MKSIARDDARARASASGLNEHGISLRRPPLHAPAVRDWTFEREASFWSMLKQSPQGHHYPLDFAACLGL
jgi:hypothetical protein